MKILSIDDSRAVHAYLTDCLNLPGVSLSHAYGGSEGLKILTSGESFDLVLLDWEMPDLSGVQVVGKLRETGFSTPIIMLTSKNAPEEIAGMLGMGVSEYVMKPFTPDILLEKIELVTGEPIQANGA